MKCSLLMTLLPAVLAFFTNAPCRCFGTGHLFPVVGPVPTTAHTTIKTGGGCMSDAAFGVEPICSFDEHNTRFGTCGVAPQRDKDLFALFSRPGFEYVGDKVCPDADGYVSFTGIVNTTTANEDEVYTFFYTPHEEGITSRSHPDTCKCLDSSYINPALDSTIVPVAGACVSDASAPYAWCNTDAADLSMKEACESNDGRDGVCPGGAVVKVTVLTQDQSGVITDFKVESSV